MLLLDLFVVALGAVASGWICRRLNVPEVLGYLAAGMLLGQGVHAFSDAASIQAIGQFAVVFRMFTLGLDFDARRLKGRWRPALTSGLLEMGACTAAGVGLSFLMGWTPLQGAVLGAALGTTSTSILSKAIADRNMSTREDARAAGAATLTEDLLAMGMLALLTVFGGAGGDARAVGESAVELVVFASLAFTAGALLLPLVLDRLGRSRSDEILTVAVIGVLFGFAALNSLIVGTPAVGAFLAGVAVGAARHAPGVAARVAPLRDLLTPTAYVSLGLLLDLGTVLRVAPVAAAVALAFVLLKVVAVTIGLRIGGTPAPTAARAGAILGQAGTMGLVFACMRFLGDAFPTLIAFAFVAWALTVGLTGLRLRFLPDVAEAVARALGGADRTRRSGRLPQGGDPAARSDAYVAVLCVGCAVAVAALASLAARADDALVPPALALPLEVALGAAGGLLVLPFAVVAGTAARGALRRRAREAALGPGRLARGRADPARSAAVAGTLGGLSLSLAAPALLAYALAPVDARLLLLAGACVAAALLLARQRWLLRACDACERLARARGAAPPDPRLHDFRGVSPFGYEVEALLVRSGTRACWATLRGLAVPERSGARVVAVVRPGAKDGAAVGPDTRLHPGDEVVLGGSPTQIVAARQYLLSPLERDLSADDRHVDADVAKPGARIA